VRRKIATGGMGEVWAGEHCTTGMRVALKTLLPELAKSREVALRFRREAELLGRLRSDRVARVIDFLVDPKHGPVLVTEFIEGRSLADVLLTERLSLEDAVDLGIEIAGALRELHRAHIVHRDLKPGNIILQPLEDGRSRAVIVDLGVSRLVSHGDENDGDEFTAITETQMVLGTIAYMAPEQIVKARDATQAADLYALGAILYRTVTGRQVFGGPTQAHVARAKLLLVAPRLDTKRTDRLARGFEEIVSRALRSTPAGRYATADEMLADLVRLREVGGIGRPRTHAPRHPLRRMGARMGERPLLWRAAGVAVVTAALMAGGLAGGFSWTRSASAAAHLTVGHEEARSATAR